MRLSTPIVIDGVTVGNAHEITPAEMLQWLDDIEASTDADIVDLLLLEEEGVSIGDLARLTDIQRDALYGMAPSMLVEVVRVAKERNKHFFGMRARIERLGALAAPMSSPVPSAT